ncbi:hypothetical protein H6F96_13485 [Microcoleus sp. FACHB-53]|nr:hypothetical protein [Microcoleus sp. FACHB-53]
MRQKPYYSVRLGKNPAAKLELPMLLQLFCVVYKKMLQEGYFQEAFGYFHSKVGRVAGTLGYDLEASMLWKLRKQNLYPIEEKCNSYSEDDLFDVIEFLYDCVSEPISAVTEESVWLDVEECWLYTKFNQETGHQKFRYEINELLRDYKDGYEISKTGEILALPDPGMESLLQEKLPEYDPENVEVRVKAAIQKFKNRHSSPDDRRDAIRDLADVLEFLRPKLKTVATQQEQDLFNIANNYDIRHHNEKQKKDYDKPIWYTWMFYFYLSTVYTAVRLIKKQEENSIQ